MSDEKVTGHWLNIIVHCNKNPQHLLRSPENSSGSVAWAGGTAAVAAGVWVGATVALETEEEGWRVSWEYCALNWVTWSIKVCCHSRRVDKAWLCCPKRAPWVDNACCKRAMSESESAEFILVESYCYVFNRFWTHSVWLKLRNRKFNNFNAQKNVQKTPGADEWWVELVEQAGLRAEQAGLR